MELLFLLTNMILPLNGLWFHTALLTQLGDWVLLPTRFFFPPQMITPSVLGTYTKGLQPSDGESWIEIGVFAALLIGILVLYLQALRHLPTRISRRYLIVSVLLLGITFVLVPIVTSQDIYSYIIYARMSVIYHLNPLTSSPMAVFEDPAYMHLYWVDQPSAYGPVWTIITSTLQWVTGAFGTENIAPMILALRLLGLTAHLYSILLIWSICGHLQKLTGKVSPRLRMQATLAFAWNPLLLFEACVNAHNDTVLLVFVLLAIWFLVRTPIYSLRSYLYATAMLGLATSLKINIVLLIPGLVLFLWTQPQRIPQRLRSIAAVLAVYVGSILVLYAPFWDHGAVLGVLQVNPSTYRNINTIAEVLTHLYNSILQLLGFPRQADIGSPAETFLHTLSMATFVVIYGGLCWQALFTKTKLYTLVQLLRWLALIWFLYCALGTPWMWPWYTVTLFGLLALIESVDANVWRKKPLFGVLHCPLAIRLFAFSMLSLYCFYTWSPHMTMGGPLYFQWMWLRGLLWFVPLLPALSSWLAQRKLKRASLSRTSLTH